MGLSKFWRWRRESAGAPRSWLALSAVFTGLALGAKYTAGITAGVLFELARFAFPWYVKHIVNYSLIFGSLGSVIMLVFWTYYMSVITVFGAEVASVCARREARHKH